MRRMTRTDSAAILCTLIRFAKAHRRADEADKALAALSVCARQKECSYCHEMAPCFHWHKNRKGTFTRLGCTHYEWSVGPPIETENITTDPLALALDAGVAHDWCDDCRRRAPLLVQRREARNLLRGARAALTKLALSVEPREEDRK
jgi:hypothetical protein